jgi:hypothetical protein
VSIAGPARLAVTVVAGPENWTVRGRWLLSGQLVPWPGGLFYCPITFDGGTVFQPEIDPEFDAAIEACYHQTMDQRLMAGAPSGDSRIGRHLFAQLRAAGVEVRAAGGSDWVVFAGSNGYAADEAYFLHCIIHTVHTALAGHPALDAERLAAWRTQRHTQVEQGTLAYIAHQLDVLGRVPAPHGETSARLMT